MLEGKREVRTEGVAGTKELVYEVTLVNGVETSRTLVSEEVTEEPVPEVIAIGTRKETERRRRSRNLNARRSEARAGTGAEVHTEASASAGTHV